MRYLKICYLTSKSLHDIATKSAIHTISNKGETYMILIATLIALFVMECLREGRMYTARDEDTSDDKSRRYLIVLFYTLFI